MKTRVTLIGAGVPAVFSVLLVLLLGGTLAFGQNAPEKRAPEKKTPEKKPFSPEEIEQLVAPIALHPDDLLSQIFMASTYPLEVVEAARWLKANPQLKGDALTAALEKQTWDPSVKSLINFPPVLKMLDEKLDWTQKLGNAILAQQKEVMDAVQRLRAKAKEQGNLKTTAEQKVVVEDKVIVIESANPEIVYVPTYNPTVVYGAWPYAAYPPYYYYPPGYVAGATAFSFAAGVAVGAAWGYAWGHCSWGHGDVDIDIDRNTNINRNIDRSKYQQQMQNRQGTGATGARANSWQHDPSHRKGVSYGDSQTAQRYNKGASATTAQSREQFRGRAEAGNQGFSRGGDSARAGSATRPSPSTTKAASSKSSPSSSARSSSSTAFSDYNRGSEVKAQSSRGQTSRQVSRPSGGGARASGGARGGGGGGRR
jgi:hypothetical protein